MREEILSGYWSETDYEEGVADRLRAGKRSADLGWLGHSLRPGPGCAATGSARRGHMASSLL